jgi:putative salt-induced outer membrane protein YdiY
MKHKSYRTVAVQIVKATVAVSVLAASVCTVSAQAPTAEVKPGWDTSAALGFTLTRGNSENLLFTGNIVTGKKWDQNEMALGADATYGESKVQATDTEPSRTEKTAESLHGFMQYNRLFTERAYGYLRLDGLHDDIADITYRFTLSPGAGYYFIKNENTRLSGEVGPAFIYEKQGDDTTGYFTLRLAERFDHKLSDRAKIWQSVEILPQVDDFDNYIVNAELGVETGLTKKSSLRAYIQDTYDNQPAEDRKKNDLKLVVALAYKF